MIKLYFDPQEEGAAGGGVAAPEVSGDFDIAGAMDRGQEPPKEEPKAQEPEAKPEEKPAEDPEFELDYEEEAGKGKAKAKLSELRDTAKWLRENRQMIAGTMKIREEAQKNPNFGKAIQTLINKSYNDKGEYQGAYVDSVLKQLEGQQEKIEEKIEDKSDDIADMEKMLDDLDADSPHAQILRKNISAAKKLRAELKSSLDQNKKFQDKLDELDKFKTGLVSEKEEATKTEQVKRLSSIYDKEIGALCDVAKSDGYKFVDADEKSDFDRAVRDGVAARANAIKSDDDFVKTVKDVAKATYDRIAKRREAYVNDYLRKKQGPQKEEIKKEQPKAPRTFAEMGELIGDAITAPPQT